MNQQKYTVPPKCFFCACDAVHICEGKYLCTDHYLNAMNAEFAKLARGVEMENYSKLFLFLA